MNRGHLESVGPPRHPAVPAHALRQVLVAPAFVAGYLLLDWMSYIHPMQQYSITPWNPQPALAIALLMLGGQRWLPLVFAAVVAAEALVRGMPAPWPATLLVGAVLSLGYAAVARTLAGPFSIDPALDSLRDALRLATVVAVGALGTGILYVAALLATGQGPLDDPFVALVRFWIGDTVGILVTLPVVLMLCVATRRAELAAMLRQPEILLHVAAIGAALAFVFMGPGSEPGRFFYVLFLPLILAATRYGMAGCALAALAIQGAVIVAGEMAGLQALTVFEFQALLIALTVTGLFLGVTVDERRRAEAELRRSMRLAAAGEMAAALAHELNQPLTAVASYARAARMLADDPRGEPLLLGQTLGKLLDESTRAADVVRRLRDFFRTGATRLAPLSLPGLAGRTLEAARALAGARGVALHLHVADPVPAVLADELQMEVVLRNLVGNAIDATAEAEAPRTVSVEVAQVAGSVVVTVRDSGPGVARADAARIFEPFETTRAHGMGMGLAISRAIVEAHGGSLQLEPGPGGTFRLRLPATREDHG
jgi:two-component system, LuxR family, sensor kinase FixL